MPLPMVHLSTAIKVCEKQQIKPSPQLLLGSITPDAIHMRKDFGREDKRVTHLTDKPELDKFKRVKSMYELYERSYDFELIKGYCIHLLTDYFWEDIVMKSFNNNLPENIPLEMRSSLYYLETDQIDFNLYRNMDWRPDVWQVLQEVDITDISSLLTAEEISLWRDRVVDWFEKIKEEPKITPKYITDSMVDTFIDKASTMILEYLFQ